MKRFGKLIALLLALAMVFALCACNTDSGKDGNGGDKAKDDDAQKSNSETVDKEKYKNSKLLGVWEAEFDLGAAIAAAYSGDDELSPLMSNMDFSGIFYSIRYTFNADGSYSIEFIDDGTTDKLRAAFRDGFVGIMEDFCAEEGVTVEEAAASENMTVDEFYDKLVEAAMESVDPIFEQVIEGSFEIDGNKLYFIADGEDKVDGTYKEFELDGDEFTIVAEYSDGEKVENATLPMTLLRCE